jgi:hypothetical protein
VHTSQSQTELVPNLGLILGLNDGPRSPEATARVKASDVKE